MYVTKQYRRCYTVTNEPNRRYDSDSDDFKLGHDIRFEAV